MGCDCCLVGVGCDASMKGDSKRNHHLLLLRGCPVGS